MTNQSIYSQLVEYPHQYYKIEAFLGMGQNVPSHPGPIPASHRIRMGPNFFSWDGMGPNLCGMGAPGPVPALCQDRDGTRSWWDGSSHPGPTASLCISKNTVSKIFLSFVNAFQIFFVNVKNLIFLLILLFLSKLISSSA